MLSPILACSSVQSAIDYYTRQLGFELAWAMPPGESGETEFAGVKLAEAEIMLGGTEGFVDESELASRGLGVQIYINLPVSIEIEQYYNTVKQNGAKIEKELEKRPWGEAAFTVRDADGYNLMFAQTAEDLNFNFRPLPN